jgi:hypothetical protein
MSAGAADDQVQVVAARLVTEGNIRVERAEEILAEMAGEK